MPDYRKTTERPVTMEFGTKGLNGTDPAALAAARREQIASEHDVSPRAIPLRDRGAGWRSAAAIAKMLEDRR